MVALGYLVASLGLSSAFTGAPMGGISKASKSKLCPQMSDVIWTPSARNGDRDRIFGPVDQYCEDRFQVRRRPTRTVTAGPVKFGSEHPIVRQTMATTNTFDVDQTVDQVMRCADEGFDLVRVTVQGKREAQACHAIRDKLFQKGYDIPLCADMHFQPKVAMMVAEAIEKIRINPGNFADGRKTFEEFIYETEDDYAMARDHFVEVFTPLVEKCKDLDRAMRIGTNHGSLSARVLSFYGDTPRGMVESAIEFADICRASDYHNFLFSMKASNPLVMSQAYRLLAGEMYRLGWDYPLHLGVTEAGEGEDGRMKSAIGIGTLLSDGLGDTIRVSLTEDPEFEYTPCNRLAEIGTGWTKSHEEQAAVPSYTDSRDITSFGRRVGALPEQREGDAVDYRGVLHRDGSVLTAVTPDMLDQPDYLYKALGCKLVVGMPFKDIATSDSILMRKLPGQGKKKARKALRRLQEVAVHVITPIAELRDNPLQDAVALVDLRDAPGADLPDCSSRMAVTIRGDETDEELAALKGLDVIAILLEVKPGLSRLHASRRVFEYLQQAGLETPVVHHFLAPAASNNEFALQLGAQVGSLLTDGFGDGVLVEPAADASFPLDSLRTTSFGLLQGSRMRNTKTEFVSCPSCGRTLFDLQEVTAQIAERTGHLPGVAIAIMGCIVNGPGEMADADFGYVGGAPGMVDLYVGKEMVRRKIPNDEACDELIDLIKEHGMWKDKEEEEEEAPIEQEAALA